jgi:hypothetical protein
LREDLTREVDRYIIIEDKYSDVLLQLEMVKRSNKKNEELVFGMSTGSNMSRY